MRFVKIPKKTGKGRKFWGRLRWVGLRLGLGAVLLVPAAFAQLDRSSLSGTVTDPEGARIPGAVVKATLLATGLERQTETPSQGTYALESLPAGQYTIVISKPEFSEVTTAWMLQEFSIKLRKLAQAIGRQVLPDAALFSDY